MSHSPTNEAALLRLVGRLTATRLAADVRAAAGRVGRLTSLAFALSVIFFGLRSAAEADGRGRTTL
jgi:hypothetical protein